MIQSTLTTAFVGRSPDATSVAPRADSTAEPESSDGPEGLHVGVIMDGNGRWAHQRGIPRSAGHRAGVPAVRRTVSAAPSHGIGVLTMYAFSSDNWRRPSFEVAHLMRLFRVHLRSEAERCLDEGVQVSVIGRRDRLPGALVAEIEAIEAETAAGRALHLQVAVDYSSRDSIVRAMGDAAEEGTVPSRDGLGALISRAVHAKRPVPDLDLVIRTGGEQRLSDFLLWEAAYAELYFTPVLWPDFDESELAAAMERFHSRERRFGGLPEPAIPSATTTRDR